MGNNERRKRALSMPLFAAFLLITTAFGCGGDDGDGDSVDIDDVLVVAPLDGEPELRWTTDVDGTDLWGDIVGNRLVLQPSDPDAPGKLVVLDTESGDLLWERNLPAGARSFSPFPSGVYVQEGQRGEWLDLDTGDPVWTIDVPEQANFNLLTLEFAALMEEASDAGGERRLEISAVDLTDGAVTATREVGQIRVNGRQVLVLDAGALTRLDPVTLEPTAEPIDVDEDVLDFMAMGEQIVVAYDDRVEVRDTSGVVLAQRDIGLEGNVVMPLASGSVFVSDFSRYVVLSLREDDLVEVTGGIGSSMRRVGDRWFLLRRELAAIELVDLDAGGASISSDVEPGDAKDADVEVSDGLVYVGGRAGLAAFDLATGEPRWLVDTPPRASLAIGDGVVAAIADNDDGRSTVRFFD
jgi:outer membrane protein assembly factor BamB